MKKSIVIFTLVICSFFVSYSQETAVPKMYYTSIHIEARPFILSNVPDGATDVQANIGLCFHKVIGNKYTVGIGADIFEYDFYKTTRPDGSTEYDPRFESMYEGITQFKHSVFVDNKFHPFKKYSPFFLQLRPGISYTSYESYKSPFENIGTGMGPWAFVYTFQIGYKFIALGWRQEYDMYSDRLLSSVAHYGIAIDIKLP